jgi:hypothetical protein
MKSLSTDYQLTDVSPVALARPELARSVFLFALLVSTLMPMIFFIWIAGREPVGFSLNGLKALLLFLGTAHVPATLFFYADKDFAPIIRNNKARYIYFPILIIVLTGLFVTVATPPLLAYLFLTFWAWQAYHYGMQNVGVYAFVSLAQQAAPPNRLERLTIQLGTFCGILGTFKLLGEAFAPAYLQGLLTALFEVGRYGFAGVLLFSLYVYFRNLKNTTALKTVFFFTLVFFFLPIYLSDNINVTFLSYAVAHGIQYLVFTTVASASLKRDQTTQRRLYGNALKLVGFILLGGLLFYFGGNVNNLNAVSANAAVSFGLNFLVGAVLGATMAHFIVDADAWRLRKTAQKQYIGNRFDFIFQRRS